MKVLVAVKRVVDYNVKVRPKSDGTDVDLANVKMSINPFCEIAVEEAVRLKEKGVVSEILAVSVGPQQSQEQLRTALALGADRAILVSTENTLEPLAIAKCLKAVCDSESPDLVLMGKQAIDGDNNQTGQMLSGLIDYSLGTFISKFDLSSDASSVEVSREIDSGIETRKLNLPAIVTVDLRLNEPRYASLPNIMKARSKPLETIELSSLGIDTAPRIKVISVEESGTKDRASKQISSAEELFTELNQMGVL